MSMEYLNQPFLSEDEAKQQGGIHPSAPPQVGYVQGQGNHQPMQTRYQQGNHPSQAIAGQQQGYHHPQPAFHGQQYLPPRQNYPLQSAGYSQQQFETAPPPYIAAESVQYTAMQVQQDGFTTSNAAVVTGQPHPQLQPNVVITRAHQNVTITATVGLVLSIISLVLCGSTFLWLSCLIPALVCAAVALGNPTQSSAKTMAILSIVLNIVSCVCFVIAIAIIVGSVSAASASYNNYSCYSYSYTYSYYNYSYRSTRYASRYYSCN